MATKATALTPEALAVMRKMTDDGATVREIAEALKISSRSVQSGRRLLRERGELPVRPDPAEVNPRRVTRELPAILASAELERAMVRCLLEAARGGSWRAAAFVLQNQFPGQWGPPEQRPPAPAAGDDPFAAVDQLAELRRRRRRTD